MAELTEVVAEAAEEVSDQADNVAEAARALSPREGKFLTAGLAIGFLTGGILGYVWANKRLRVKYEEVTQEEIDSMREHFRKRALVKEEKPDLSAAVDEITEREGYSKPQTPLVEEGKDGVQVGETEEVKVEVVEEKEIRLGEAPRSEVSPAQVTTNLFEKQEKDANEGWDYEHEVNERIPTKPYIIHHDEQHEHEGYTEMSLIYYAADDVLTDYHDTPVEDKEKVAGEANLEKFGHGSDDPNIVYIRNDVLEIEMEIVKNDGSFAEIVHGFKHGEYGSTRKARFDDEPGSG
jgi:hypothetical protein